MTASPSIFRASGGEVPDDWRKASSHDLRRYYAQDLLVRERMNPRIVMQVGGWNSFSAIDPYLNTPTSEVVNAAFEPSSRA